ncbi:MAG: hypothetical protein KAH17_03350 [Bacteroidales bacterium]|nr:hypothetical protein [Bacteroidales bacterium]
MKRFFKWLLTIFRPDSKKYVKNIQGGSDSNNSKSSYSASKRKRSFPAVLAWSHKSDIIENNKDNQGVSISISMKPDTGFHVLNLPEAPLVQSRKKGLSAVAHRLEFMVDTDIESTVAFIEEAKGKKPLCFLYRSGHGDVVILGEENGLELIEYDGSKIEFSGEETDVFFHVSEECFIKLLPNIEK